MPRTVHEAMMDSDDETVDDTTRVTRVGDTMMDSDNETVDVGDTLEEDESLGDTQGMEATAADGAEDHEDTDDATVNDMDVSGEDEDAIAASSHHFCSGAVDTDVPRHFRIRATSFLMTWVARKPKEGETEEDVVDYPPDFLLKLKAMLETFSRDVKNPVLDWTCCEELTKDGRRHFHAFVIHKKRVDRIINAYKVDGEGTHPNNICGNAARGKQVKKSLARGLFYCRAPKIDRVDGYTSSDSTELLMRGQATPHWLIQLVQQGKMTPMSAMELAREWGAFDPRFFQAMQYHANAQQAANQMQTLTVMMAMTEPLRPFRTIPVVEEWKEQYTRTPYPLRYKFLVIEGPSGSGKSKFAESLFDNPHNHLGLVDWRRYEWGTHKAIIFHDVPNIFRYILTKREMFQANTHTHTVLESPTMVAAREIILFRTPIIIVCNNDEIGTYLSNEREEGGEWLRHNSIAYHLGADEHLWEDAQ
jgi:hypothetical protein